MNTDSHDYELRIKDILTNLREQQKLLNERVTPLEFKGPDGVETEGLSLVHSETSKLSTQSLANDTEIELCLLALQKIAEGTFGLCEECEEDIPRSRVRLKPQVPFCVECMSRLEKELALRFGVRSSGPRNSLSYALPQLPDFFAARRARA